jgi:hypothetical protein
MRVVSTRIVYLSAITAAMRLALVHRLDRDAADLISLDPLGQ